MYITRPMKISTHIRQSCFGGSESTPIAQTIPGNRYIKYTSPPFLPFVPYSPPLAMSNFYIIKVTVQCRITVYKGQDSPPMTCRKELGGWYIPPPYQ